MSHIAITAVIPAFNREEHIGRALASVLGQTSPPDEILVVDDGSQDATAEIARSVAGVAVLQQENRGAGPARDAGLRSATCRWVAFLDSDDEWTSNHLARMRHAIEKTQGDAALYFADVQLPASEGSTLWRASGFDIGTEPYLLQMDGAPWAFRPRHPMLLQAAVVHRQRALITGGFHPSLTRAREDTLFFLSLSLDHPVCAVSGIGTVMHEDAPCRLGERDRRKSDQYWTDTVFLYRHLRTRARGNLAATRQCQLRELHGWLRLANGAAQRKQFAKCVMFIAAGLRVAPLQAVSRMLDKVRKQATS